MQIYLEIIEGASKGIGLGISFLKHIERVHLIVYILDVNSLKLANEYKTLRWELEQYSKELLKKQSLLVFNKIDLVDYDMELLKSIYEDFLQLVKLFDEEITKIPVFFLSAKDAIDNGNLLKDFVDSLFSFFPHVSFAEILSKKRVIV